jgi:Leucine-rich repeat (LRR) protein
MKISPEQKRSLAKYRKLIGSNDWGIVNQALELLKVDGDCDLWHIFSDGVRVWRPGDAGNRYSIIIPKEAEIYKKVKAPYRGVVALNALLATGKLEAEEGLYLKNCQFISDLSFFQNLKDLTRLTLSLSDLPINLSPLGHLKKLDMLSLQGLKGLSDISVFEELPALKTLWISFCPSLTNFNSISRLHNLEWVVIDFCHSLNDLNALRDLKMLRILRISTCSNLTDYSALENLSSLEELGLSGLNIGDGAFLSGMTGLKKG